MNTKNLFPFVFIGLLAIGFIQMPNITGKWFGYLKFPNGDSAKFVYDFKVKEDELSGSMTGPDGTVAIEGGTIKDSIFRFYVYGMRGEIFGVGRYYGDSIGMNLDTSRMFLHVSLKRLQ
jgi:hypothetical protein